jgi:hypothetical protein
MRNVKRIASWILVSLVLQSAVLFYLDKNYFVTETEFETKKIETPTAKQQKEEIIVKVPEEAKHVSVSYDGKFLSYDDNGMIKVTNTVTGLTNDVAFEKEEKVSFYKWLPDTNLMIIAQKKTVGKEDILTFSNYDAPKNKKKEISTDNRGKSISITLPDNQSEVENIELSPLTNMIYVKINHKGNRNTIYSMNVMAQIEKLKLNTFFAGNILTFPHEARMAYEDKTYNRIYVTGVNKPISINGVSKPGLIATDDENRLYIGQLDSSDKVEKVYYGMVKDAVDKWKSVDFKKPVDKRDLFVSSDGSIYINNNLKGVVTNMHTGKETAYTGKFLKMFNGGIAAVSDGKLIKIPLDK